MARGKWLVAAGAAAALAVLAAAGRPGETPAPAETPRAAGAAAPVGILDLQRAMRGCPGREEGEARLQVRIEEIRRQREEDLRELNQRLNERQREESLATGERREQARRELAQLRWQIGYERERGGQQIDEAVREFQRGLYLRVAAAAGRVARARGMVCVLRRPEVGGAIEDAWEELVRSSVVWCDPAVELTDEVLAALNAEAAATPAAGATATPAAGAEATPRP